MEELIVGMAICCSLLVASLGYGQDRSVTVTLEPWRPHRSDPSPSTQLEPSTDPKKHATDQRPTTR